MAKFFVLYVAKCHFFAFLGQNVTVILIEYEYSISLEKNQRM